MLVGSERMLGSDPREDTMFDTPSVSFVNSLVVVREDGRLLEFEGPFEFVSTTREFEVFVRDPESSLVGNADGFVDWLEGLASASAGGDVCVVWADGGVHVSGLVTDITHEDDLVSVLCEYPDQLEAEEVAVSDLQS